MATLELPMGLLRQFLSDTISAAQSAVELYFRPLHWIANPGGKASHLTAHRIPELDQKEMGLLRLINAVICYNQGALIDYSFLIADKHKAMKREYLSNATNTDTLKELTD